MSRPWIARLAAAAAVISASAVLVTGCAFGPDPEEVREHAAATFDDLLAVLAETDPAVLRGVQATPATEQACGEGDEGTQSAFVATGTLSITATPDAGETAAEAVADALDPEVWDRIRTAADAPGQRAWAAEDGVVVTVTFDDPVLVAAVFTPCTT